MTRNKGDNRQRSKKTQNDDSANAKGTEKEVSRLDSLDEEDQGFGGWLRVGSEPDPMRTYSELMKDQESKVESLIVFMAPVFRSKN
ncbi:hypothetical protein RR46_00272 [Papilio xuthus]|uniref:Uncharacterized protein n=1 Tax=Papilio xuthus TaxID=66420 RepID=A0A0N0P9Q3_PAPXU|nr:hypothetical protein RR46_00272 [Papilio xuthus]